MVRGTILTIEDDPAIRRGIVDALSVAGFRVIEAADGPAGLDKALNCEYDLALLDLVLPPPMGLEILEQLRADRPSQPVVILTAKGDEKDRIRGLQLGADDYVVKPFSIGELLARIEAVLRRSSARPRHVESLQLETCYVCFTRREVRFTNGDRIELAEREAQVLLYLARHAGRPISRDELLRNVWRIDPRGTRSRTVDMHIARLREKLRDTETPPQVVQTIRGRGYLFAADVNGEMGGN